MSSALARLNSNSIVPLLICLLSNVAVTLTVPLSFNATADQGNQVAVTQDAEGSAANTINISFAAESKDVKVGSFHYYRFQGTDTANIDKVTLKSADESALKIDLLTFKCCCYFDSTIIL